MKFDSLVVAATYVVIVEPAYIDSHGVYGPPNAMLSGVATFTTLQNVGKESTE